MCQWPSGVPQAAPAEVAEHGPVDKDLEACARMWEWEWEPGGAIVKSVSKAMAKGGGFVHDARLKFDLIGRVWLT